MKVDLHSHTSYSRDSLLKPAELVARARSFGLHRIAVTDHNELDGAHEAKAIDPSLVIIGEEIDCENGTHLIGLFLRERIPPGLSVPHTAARIREQGGVVYAPHPYAYMSVATSRALQTIAVADVVEVFNARAFLPAWNRRALDAARARGLPLAAGTDSHFAFEVGSAWTELPEFDNADGLRRSLAQARPIARGTQSPLIHCASLAVEMLKTVGILARRRSGTSPAPSPSATNPATSLSD